MMICLRDARMRLLGVAIAISLSACIRAPARSVPDGPPPVAEAEPEVEAPGLGDAFDELNLETGEREEGLVVNLPSVFLFEFDSDVLNPGAVERLLEVAKVLNQPMAADRTIRIEGHTDSLGRPEYNLALSERRARAVMEQLSAGNVEAHRMTIRGLGSTVPRVPNKADGADDPDGRAQNRRVEIIIEDPPDLRAQDTGGSRE